MNLIIFLPFLFLSLLFSLLSFSLPLFLPFEIRDYKGLYFSFLFQEEKARRNQMCNTFFSTQLTFSIQKNIMIQEYQATRIK